MRITNNRHFTREVDEGQPMVGCSGGGVLAKLWCFYVNIVYCVIFIRKYPW